MKVAVVSREYEALVARQLQEQQRYTSGPSSKQDRPSFESEDVRFSLSSLAPFFSSTETSVLSQEIVKTRTEVHFSRLAG